MGEEDEVGMDRKMTVLFQQKRKTVYEYCLPVFLPDIQYEDSFLIEREGRAQ